MSKKTESGAVEASRRKALKIAGGTAITATVVANAPTQWSKPVVDSVVLPAHALTSAPPVDAQPPATTPAPTTTDGGFMGSDIRLKTAVAEVGKTNHGLGLYRFQYLDDPNKTNYVGVMAQDLIEEHPEALRVNEQGYFQVRYDLLGLRMTTLEAWEKDGVDSVIIKH